MYGKFIELLQKHFQKSIPIEFITVTVLCKLEITVEALLTDILVRGQLYFRSPWQNPFLPGSLTVFVFTHSCKWLAPVTDTISAARESLLTGALTVAYKKNIRKLACKIGAMGVLSDKKCMHVLSDIWKIHGLTNNYVNEFLIIFFFISFALAAIVFACFFVVNV